MAEPLGLATAIGTLISYGYKLTKTTYEAIDSFKTAPKHLRAISRDLKALYSVLGPLYGYLSEDDTATGVLHRSISLELKEVLANCVDIFKELATIVNEYSRDEIVGNVAKWHSALWPWKEKEVTRWREHLSANKITLNIAIASIKL